MSKVPSLVSERAAPRPGVLLALGAAVLLAHLGLLSGGFSGLSLDMFAATDSDAPGVRPTAEVPPATDTAAVLPTPEVPEPVRTSRVRWIVPKAPEPPPAPPPPPARKPPPEPELVVEPPPPEPPVEAAAPPPPVAPPVEPPPQEPAAVAQPVAPAPDAPSGPAAASGTVVAAGAGLGDASLPPAVVPPTVSLRYAVTAIAKGSTYSGSGQLEWKHDGQQYEARLTLKALVFTIGEQSSAGRLTDRGLAPDRFTDRRRSNERATHFDREGQRLRYSNNAPDGKLLPGTQDRLSLNFQLAGLFNARPDAYAEGQTLRLPVTSIDTAEVWLFQVGPEGPESLPAGEVTARKLTRSPRREYDRKVEVWLLPGYAHLPGRIRTTEPNGDHWDMRLERLPDIEAARSDTP